MKEGVNVTQEIAELRQLSVPALVSRYRAVFGRPPRIKHREHLWKRIAWKIQEQRYGGLSELARKRLEELIADIDLPLPERQRTVSGKLKGSVKPGDPPVGTTLTRRWKGQDISVHVVEGGFEYEGTVYGSLSAAAKAVTGSHWNGRLFFGLSERRKKS